jgi:hypothetical protein
MQGSLAPRIEISKAAKAIDDMEGAATLEDFEEQWKTFLQRLERSVNKAQAHFKKSPKWDSWWGKYKALRTNDELLSYMVYARGAEEHSVEEIVSREGGGLAINPAFGNVLAIKKMTMFNGVITEFNSPHPVRFDFLPQRTKLLPVLNRGRTYSVPTKHLGSPIDSQNVIEIAKMGLKFYDEFLIEADKYFVH